jgi:hypothetical protein
MEQDRGVSGYVDAPYSSVDALLEQFFSYGAGIPKPSSNFRRASLTSGSCEYRILADGQVLYSVYVASLSENRTLLRVVVPAPVISSTGVLGFPLEVADTLLGHLALEVRTGYQTWLEVPEAAEHAPSDLAAYYPAQRRPRGAEQDPTNREAREAITRGEDRKAVFRKWAKTKKYNLSDPTESQKAEGAFRRMLNRKPQSN